MSLKTERIASDINRELASIMALEAKDETLKHNSILLASLIFSYMMRNDYVVRY